MTVEAKALFLEFPTSVGCLHLAACSDIAVSFKPFGRVADLLADLPTEVRIGFLSFLDGVDAATAQQLLKESGVLEGVRGAFFDHIPVSAKTHFQTAASRIGIPPNRCVFVSGDAHLRTAALGAHFLTAPSLSLAKAVLLDEELFYVRLRDRKNDLRAQAMGEIPDLQPLHQGSDPRTAYAIGTAQVISALREGGLNVEILGERGDVGATDLVLIRNAYDDSEFLHRVAELSVVDFTPDGLLIGIPGDGASEDFRPLTGGHGNLVGVRLLPSPRARSVVPPPPLPKRDLLPSERHALQNDLNAALIKSEALPLYQTPLDACGVHQTIDSRNIHHCHNPFAVKHIAKRLEAILGKATRQPFSFAGRSLANVEGEITGNRLPDDVVIIGAHLDSIVENTPHWTGEKGKAPGADDDASGVAGVLAAATVLKTLAKTPPKRTIRFVLFNAEEARMAGSYHYVNCLTLASNQQVVAMFQMDMIGYTRGVPAPRTYEIHASSSNNLPSTDKSVITQASVLAERLKAATAISKGLSAPQVYPLPGCPSDPAYKSSDHFMFLTSNWPACLVTEEFFVDICSTTNVKKYHPNYHTENDTIMCFEYAADIARVVAAAAWMIADGS